MRDWCQTDFRNTLEYLDVDFSDQSKIEDCKDTAMNVFNVKKGKRPHIRRILDKAFANFDEYRAINHKQEFPSNLLEPTYEELHNALTTFSTKFVNPDEIDAVIGLARGGLFPSVILSHKLKKPHVCVDFSSERGKGDDTDQHINVIPDIPYNRVLIVDDICDSGHTMAEIVTELQERGIDVSTCVLYLKDGSAFLPDFHWTLLPKDAGWVIFPFEK